MNRRCKLKRGACLPDPYPIYRRKELVSLAKACGVRITRPPDHPKTGRKDMVVSITHGQDSNPTRSKSKLFVSW